MIDTQAVRDAKKKTHTQYNLHIGGKHVESLVKVIHLDNDTHANKDSKDIGRGVGKLIRAREGQLEGNAKSLGSHDSDGPNQRADRDIDDRSLVAVSGHHSVDHVR